MILPAGAAIVLVDCMLELKLCLQLLRLDSEVDQYPVYCSIVKADGAFIAMFRGFGDRSSFRTGESFRGVTSMETVSVLEEKAEVPPFVDVSTFAPAVPVVVSHARKVRTSLIVP